MVQRLTPDLRVDTTFGTNGVWSSNVTGDDDVIAVTVDFAGKVVVLATNGPDSYALYRLNP